MSSASGKIPHAHRSARGNPASHVFELLGHRQGSKGLTVVEVPGKPADSSAYEAVPVLPDKEPEALPPLPAPVRGDRQSALLLPLPLLLYSQQGTSACRTNQTLIGLLGTASRARQPSFWLRLSSCTVSRACQLSFCLRLCSCTVSRVRQLSFCRRFCSCTVSWALSACLDKVGSDLASGHSQQGMSALLLPPLLLL